MEHKFLNSKIFHVVHILVLFPHKYTSTGVQHKQPKSLRTKFYSKVKKIGVECVLRHHQKLVFEKKRRNIGHIIHKFVLI